MQHLVISKLKLVMNCVRLYFHHKTSLRCINFSRYILLYLFFLFNLFFGVLIWKFWRACKRSTSTFDWTTRKKENEIYQTNFVVNFYDNACAACSSLLLHTLHFASLVNNIGKSVNGVRYVCCIFRRMDSVRL